MLKKSKKKRILNHLFWRISLAFLIIISIIGVAYVFITVYHSGIYFQHVNQQLNRSVAANIISNSPPLLDSNLSQPDIDTVFKNIMAVNPGLEVYLVDKAGTILSYHAPGKEVILRKIDLRPVHQFIHANGKEYITGDDPRHPGNRKVFSAAPIMNSGSPSGYLYVVLASEEYVAVTEFLKGNFVIELGSRTMILTLVATLLTGLFVIRVLTKNFSEIIAVMQKFRLGDINARVKVKSSGDVKELADIFNEMADILTRNIEKLKEVEVLRRELIANVSHDLRTPISIIQGYAETILIKENSLSHEDRKHYLNIILESAVKLGNLVNELFELSKLEANQVQPQKEPFNISELISDISYKYHLTAKQKGITITTARSRHLSPVYADVSLIERVMQNLVDNAIKFTQNGGEILLSTNNADGQVEVRVTDSGIGIPESERENIFARYYKVENFSELKNNTGLGLAIVKKILDLHGSTLEFTSSPDKGTTFYFLLPAHQNS